LPILKKFAAVQKVATNPTGPSLRSIPNGGDWQANGVFRQPNDMQQVKMAYTHAEIDWKWSHQRFWNP